LNTVQNLNHYNKECFSNHSKIEQSPFYVLCLFRTKVKELSPLTIVIGNVFWRIYLKEQTYLSLIPVLFYYFYRQKKYNINDNMIVLQIFLFVTKIFHQLQIHRLKPNLSMNMDKTKIIFIKRVISGIFQVILVLSVKAQVYIPDNNLISNGNFISRDPQQRPLRWISGTGLQTATVSPDERHGFSKDDRSLEVADTSIFLSALVRSEKKIASPGTKYIATGWIKTKDGNPGHLNLEFWDQNNVIIDSKSVSVQSDPDWQEVKAVGPAPDKCTHVTISITTGEPDTGIFYCDDVSLVFETTYVPDLITGIRELFMDDFRIEEMVDVQRVVNPGIKSKIMINPIEPWEGNAVYIYGTVLKDEPGGSGYRMWYTAYKDEYYLCYATSKHGINWVKPRLGLVDFKGSKQNNICKVGGGNIVYDPAEKDASKRYKLLCFNSSKERWGYNIYFSSDGLKWDDSYQKVVLPYGDVSNVAYDKDKRLFIAITKQRMLISNTSVTPGKNDRAAFVSVSKNFIDWSAPDAPNSLWTLAVEGDYADDQLVMSKGGIESNVYGMPVYPYQNIYIGFPWMFDIETYTKGIYAVTGDGKIQPQVAVSRDLKHWSRPAREPIIPLGKSGAWDDGTLYTSSTMQITESEMSVYYGAMNLPHGGNTTTQVQYARIAKASWRRDGLISLYNDGGDPGTITTKIITFQGNQLKVNTKLNKGGSLRVEILDEDGKAVDGYQLSQANPIVKDHLMTEVKWNSGKDLSKLKGKEIKLRFYLDGGHLYSYWFE
jgi:hypothetical protein